jgi:hypothetical protein
MNLKLVRGLAAVALVGCGGLTTVSGDAGQDAGADVPEACFPYLTPWTSTVASPCDNGCQRQLEIDDGPTKQYGLCTNSCTAQQPCPLGFACEMTLGLMGSFCFPQCSDGGACPTPLSCNNNTSACD